MTGIGVGMLYRGQSAVAELAGYCEYTLPHHMYRVIYCNYTADIVIIQQDIYQTNIQKDIISVLQDIISTKYKLQST